MCLGVFLSKKSKTVFLHFFKLPGPPQERLMCSQMNLYLTISHGNPLQLSSNNPSQHWHSKTNTFYLRIKLIILIEPCKTQSRGIISRTTNTPSQECGRNAGENAVVLRWQCERNAGETAGEMRKKCGRKCGGKCGRKCGSTAIETAGRFMPGRFFTTYLIERRLV